MVSPFCCPFQDNPSAAMWIANKLCIANCYFHSDWSCSTTSQHFLSSLNLALSPPKPVDEILGASDFWFCFYNIHFLIHLAWRSTFHISNKLEDCRLIQMLILIYLRISIKKDSILMVTILIVLIVLTWDDLCSNTAPQYCCWNYWLVLFFFFLCCCTHFDKKEKKSKWNCRFCSNKNKDESK